MNPRPAAYKAAALTATPRNENGAPVGLESRYSLTRSEAHDFLNGRRRFFDFSVPARSGPKVPSNAVLIALAPHELPGEPHAVPRVGQPAQPDQVGVSVDVEQK